MDEQLDERTEQTTYIVSKWKLISIGIVLQTRILKWVSTIMNSKKEMPQQLLKLFTGQITLFPEKKCDP